MPEKNPVKNKKKQNKKSSPLSTTEKTDQREKYTSLKGKHPEYLASKSKLNLNTFIEDAFL